jgi:hypothetical protein
MCNTCETVIAYKDNGGGLHLTQRECDEANGKIARNILVQLLWEKMFHVSYSRYTSLDNDLFHKFIKPLSNDTIRLMLEDYSQ